MAIDKKCKKVCEKRTRKNFRPFAVPRYLPGSVPIAVLKEDLKMYNEHRFNVYVAKAKVDTSPPKMNPYNYLNLTKLADNARRLQRIDHENKGLVRKINLINRHGVSSINLPILTVEAHIYLGKGRYVQCKGIRQKCF